MCGISGIIYKVDDLISSEEVNNINNALESRGPDGEGIYNFNNVYLAHKRLSIIDINGGQQPFESNCGNYAITYNGELYNYEQLKKELENLGVVFVSNSDTEVLLYSYIKWGKKCLSRFQGMFSFCILDKLKHLCFLSRDHFGIKPLYIYQDEVKIAFASEIKALTKLEYFNSEINIDSLDDYLWLSYIPGPKTIYKRILKLEPGHYMIIDHKGNISHKERYFKPEFSNRQEENFDWYSELKETIKQSVEQHLVSDVPVGAFLSGGIDSSLIVANIAKINGGESLKTFSIGFNESDFSELKYAKQVAEKFRTDHHEEIVTPDTLSILPDLVNSYGEPFGDSSALPTYYLSKMTSNSVKVALSGDGGDELFAGYGSHVNWVKTTNIPEWYSNFPSHKRYLYNILNKVSRNKFPISWSPDTFKNWIKFSEYLNEDLRMGIWKKEYKDKLNKNIDLSEIFTESRHYKDVRTVQSYDLQTYLPYDILTKVDVASMMNSLEVRTPFIDINVWNMAKNIPVSYNMTKAKSGRLQGKSLLKQILLEDFDKDFVHRNKKGFGVPLVHWFTENDKAKKLINELLVDNRNNISEYFDINAIRHIVSHGDPQHKWLLLFLEFWFIENK